jgi:aconitate hydratase
MEYLRKAGLAPSLEALGFHLVAFGCTTCIGNSGPLPRPIADAVAKGGLAVASVLSGNRNFEGRIHTQVRANYLASPPLVVAYALTGNMNMDLAVAPLGTDPGGRPVYLRDIWPSPQEIEAVKARCMGPDLFAKSYADVFRGPEAWRSLAVPSGELYAWDTSSTYIREPPFLKDLSRDATPPADIRGARVLALLGDMITTDHISPAGQIGAATPAGRYLASLGVKPDDFNSYGARRGNHEVMVRGTFANVQLKNLLAPATEGGVTRCQPGGELMSIFDASQRYRAQGIPLMIIAGKEYGAGSSRDWAAKGPQLLGVRAVLAEGFERIHRSNLIGMGILPVQFMPGDSAASLGLTGGEAFDLVGLASLTPGATLDVTVMSPGKPGRTLKVLSRIDTPIEIEYFRHGGVLPYVLRQLLKD